MTQAYQGTPPLLVRVTRTVLSWSVWTVTVLVWGEVPLRVTSRRWLPVERTPSQVPRPISLPSMAMTFSGLSLSTRTRPWSTRRVASMMVGWVGETVSVRVSVTKPLARI